MFDWLREAFDYPAVKYSAFGVGLFAVLLGFLAFAQSGQNSTCAREGFDEYDQGAKICRIKPGQEENTLDAYSIIAGNTANTPSPVYTIPNELKNADGSLREIINTLANGGTVKVISAATGNAVKTFTLKQNTTNDANGFIKSLKETVQEINHALGEAPNADGATYLEAITKAGREAVSQGNKKKVKVIVRGSGLSDGGALNFADDDLLHKELDEVVSSLEEAGEIVEDLKGLKTITWYGIGQTISPQIELFDSERDAEKKIYRQILEKRGVETVNFDDTMQDSKGIDNNSHTVKPVSVYIEIPHKELNFIENSATFVDESAARKTLNDVISKAKNRPTAKITITGYMAAGNCDSSKPNNPTLALERANAVKNLLSHEVRNSIEVIDGKVFNPSQSECDANSIWQASLANGKRKITIRIK